MELGNAYNQDDVLLNELLKDMNRERGPLNVAGWIMVHSHSFSILIQ